MNNQPTGKPKCAGERHPPGWKSHSNPIIGSRRSRRTCQNRGTAWQRIQGRWRSRKSNNTKRQHVNKQRKMGHSPVLQGDGSHNRRVVTHHGHMKTVTSIGKEGQSKTKPTNREARCGTTARARRHHGVENERGGGSHNSNGDESEKRCRIGDPNRKTLQEGRFARNTKRDLPNRPGQRNWGRGKIRLGRPESQQVLRIGCT